MFDVGFWELSVIAVVALLVVGPERLPKLARTLGLWAGRGRRFIQTVKADIDNELAAEELKNVLAKQAELPELHDIIEESEQVIGKPESVSSEQAPLKKQQVTDKSNDSTG